jgi:phospholipid transport system substrate-binding protein
MIRAAFMILTACALLPGAMAADPCLGIAEQRLKSSVDKVVDVAKASGDRQALIAGVKPVLEDILSFETMTRRAIGPGWKAFTPDQQKEAVRLFTVLILRTYTAKFTPGEYPSVLYKPSASPSPGRVEIPTTALYKGSRYEVIYRLENKSPVPDHPQDWMITDVVIEGVSMVGSYRSQFDEEDKKGGPKAVLEALGRSANQAP